MHFRQTAPDTIPYAIHRYQSEAQRHYAVLDAHLAGRAYIVGDGALAAYPQIARWFAAIDSRPAVARARGIVARYTGQQGGH